MVPYFQSFSIAIKEVARRLYNYGYEVHTERWQGLDIQESPQHQMLETMNVSFSCPISSDINELKRTIKPNLPWADDHFKERVGGEPLNPGEQYKHWPYYRDNKSNDIHRVEKSQFSHTYMERIWPKYANQKQTACESCGTKVDGEKDLECSACGEWLTPFKKTNRSGIRYEYGDLKDVLALLQREPLTRQAYLPIWFPEDTGVVFGGRVPCTLGYHFMRRANHLHVVYYIRSCDFFRHFRDDIYLCALKVHWIIDELKRLMPGGPWSNVRPGILTMHITSMHCFSVEKPLVKKEMEA